MRFLLTKRFWKRLAVGLVVLVAVALLANGVMTWRTDSQLNARIAAIRAAGDPASIADMKPQPIPDDQNAAAILERITARLNEFSWEEAHFSDSPIGKEYREAQDRCEPATPEQIAAIRAILSKYPDVEQALSQAAACEKYASRLDFSLQSTEFIDALIKTQGNVRTAARFISWRMEVLLADGQREQSIEHGTMAYRLARLYESEPSMVAYLVAIAVRGRVAEQLYDALAAGPVSPEVCAALDVELARMEDPLRLVHTLKTERAISAGWTGLILQQPYPFLVQMFGWPIKSLQVGAIDFSNEYLTLVGRPWSEVQAKLGAANAPVPKTGHGMFADLLSPALRAVFQAHARSLTVSRALRIDIALRQFAQKSGREAQGLDELALPQDTKLDPFSGGPLKLQPTDDGWMIYSVMDNGVDDGGNFKKQLDFGLAPPKRRSTE